jgi:hypothetical protein
MTSIVYLTSIVLHVVVLQIDSDFQISFTFVVPIYLRT